MTVFGVFLPQMRFGYEEMVRQTKEVEDFGFDSVWYMDHLIAEGKPEWDVMEAWTLASALATQTSRVRIGHLVLCNGFRHPAVLAKMACTLDVISGGRLDLGLGWGSVPRELKVYGLGIESAAVRSAKLDEALTIIRAMFEGGPVTFDGRYYSVYKAYCQPRPVNGHIPILIGGGGRKLTMPLVAKHADWWNCPTNAFGELEELAAMRGSARISVQNILAIAPTTAAKEEAAEIAQRRFGFWGGGIVTGTPDEVTEQLLVQRKLGAEKFIFRFHDFGTEQSYRLFMDEIAPAVR